MREQPIDWSKVRKTRCPRCDFSLRFETDDVTYERTSGGVVSYIEVRCPCGEVFHMRGKCVATFNQSGRAA